MAADAQARNIRGLNELVKVEATRNKGGARKSRCVDGADKGEVDPKRPIGQHDSQCRVCNNQCVPQRTAAPKEVKQITDFATTDILSLHSYRR